MCVDTWSGSYTKPGYEPKLYDHILPFFVPGQEPTEIQACRIGLIPSAILADLHCDDNVSDTATIAYIFNHAPMGAAEEI